MEYLQNAHYQALRRKLAELYPLQHLIRSVLDQVEISPGEVILQGRGVDMWDSVLSVAQKNAKMEMLLLVVESENKGEPVIANTLKLLANGEGVITKRSLGVQREGLPTAFLMYDPRDGDVVDPLKAQLRVLARWGNVAFVDQHERLSAFGDQAADLIGSSTLVLLLMTANFMDNDECMSLTISAAEAGKRVVPVLLSSCLWNRALVLASITPLPINGKFVDDPRNAMAYKEIAARIETLLQT